MWKIHAPQRVGTQVLLTCGFSFYFKDCAVSRPELTKWVEKGRTRQGHGLNNRVRLGEGFRKPKKMMLFRSLRHVEVRLWHVSRDAVQSARLRGHLSDAVNLNLDQKGIWCLEIWLLCLYNRKQCKQIHTNIACDGICHRWVPRLF